MSRILIIEDDPDVLTLVAHKLRRAGHDVSSATDGREGLSALRLTLPDLVILDWMMPGLSGLEVCREVRDDASISRTRLMMLTAKAQAQDVELAFAAGADEYLLKPFSSAQLFERVDALLART